MSVPATMKAFVNQGDGKAGIEMWPTPTIEPHEVLVKVVAVAQNPTDWKSLSVFARPKGNILGCDYSGHVVQVGDKVTDRKVGDHVAGFVMGGTFPDRGAFAEYLRVDAALAIPIPAGTLSHEEASTLACALWTAYQGLFHPTRLGLVEPPEKTDKPEWVFIYGGSSSVGMFAINLAHIAGYKVITTASPHNFDKVKAFGADAVFDYKDPNVVTQIKEATGDSLHIALDTISLPETQKFSMKVLGPGKGKLVVILEADGELNKLRDDVSVIFTVVYTTHGIEFQFLGNRIPAVEADYTHTVQFVRKVPQLVQSGLLKPNPVRVLPDGLESIKEGFQLLEQNKVSGEKLVHVVSQ